MATSAIATIQFVGLILFSQNLSTSDHTLRAMIPKIPGPPRVRTERTTLTPPKLDAFSALPAEQAMAITNVETHWAYISFAADVYDPTSSWKAIQVPRDKKNTLYVRLNGEQIQFVSSSTPVTPQKPDVKSDLKNRRQPVQGTFVARFIQSPMQQYLNLKHLQECCAEPRLRPEYMAPGYRLAAAVFDLSNLSVGSCAGAGTPGDERRDTIGKFDNDGVLIIKATNMNKELRLKGSAYVFVGNMPPDELTGIQPINPSTAVHSLTWQAVIARPAPACSRKRACTEGLNPIANCGGAFPSTNFQVWREGITSGPSVDTQGHTMNNMSGCEYCRTDAECSNTQWP